MRCLRTFNAFGRCNDLSLTLYKEDVIKITNTIYRIYSKQIFLTFRANDLRHLNIASAAV